MVIDSSALLAILQDEPERRRFNEYIEADPRRLLSAASLLEASIVVESRGGEAAGRELDLFLHRARVEVVAVDAEQVEIARGVSAVRKGAASGGSELRRLLQLRAGAVGRGTAAVPGFGFQPDGSDGGRRWRKKR